MSEINLLQLPPKLISLHPMLKVSTSWVWIRLKKENILTQLKTLAKQKVAQNYVFE
ncbi:hypothetical protein [Nostoc sp.]|uniref:hypothetical protein n=1 Tax=Nostoc sp. TaxID=1180 RepID=UPI002FFB5D23